MRDYELVGYDNFESHGVHFWPEPTVTSVDYPLSEEAAAAAALLLRQLGNPDGSLLLQFIPNRLVIRKTALADLQ